jgi:hypothetical protein
MEFLAACSEQPCQWVWKRDTWKGVDMHRVVVYTQVGSLTTVSMRHAVECGAPISTSVLCQRMKRDCWTRFICPSSNARQVVVSFGALDDSLQLTAGVM